MGVPLLSIENSTVICAKTAEPIGMPFGLWAQMGRRNRAGWGSIDAEGRCHGNQFWDTICYSCLWRLMGYNFGCMIASDTQFDSSGGVKLSDEDIAEIECERVERPCQPVLGLKLLLTGFMWTTVTRQSL